jgi:hypothetical protein
VTGYVSGPSDLAPQPNVQGIKIRKNSTREAAAGIIAS